MAHPRRRREVLAARDRPKPARGRTAAAAPPNDVVPRPTTPEPAGEQQYVKGNTQFFAVALQGGGGPFAVVPSVRRADTPQTSRGDAAAGT